MPAQKKDKAQRAESKPKKTTRGRQKTFFQVESIHEEKEENGIPFYLIKWEGYPIEESTWEPFENVRHLKEILHVWELTKSAASARLADQQRLEDFQNLDEIEAAEEPEEPGTSFIAPKPASPLNKRISEMEKEFDMKFGSSQRSSPILRQKTISPVVNVQPVGLGLTRTDWHKCIGIVFIIFFALMAAWLERQSRKKYW